MPKLQSRRARAARSHHANAWKRLPPEQGAEVLRARRERRDAARMALPAPCYPPARMPGQYAGYIEIHDAINGWTVRHELAVPSDRGGRRARVDSLTLTVEGRPVATGGWHEVFRYLVAKVLPRSLPVRALASLRE